MRGFLRTNRWVSACTLWLVLLLVPGAVWLNACGPRSLHMATRQDRDDSALIRSEEALMPPEVTDTDVSGWLRIRAAFSHLEPVDERSSRGPSQVSPLETPWATAHDHRQVVHNMDAILRENGVDSIHMRVRMIAHAIVASGWRQRLWHHNAWGVKKGLWKGDWYVMPTVEVDGEGNEISISDETWRVFSDWSAAVSDFLNRIRPDSTRPAYRKAYAHLASNRVSVRDAVDYWEALGAGNYYTAKAFTGRDFARLCSRVRSCLNSETVDISCSSF